MPINTNEFEYEQTITCGPTKLDQFDKYKNLSASRWEYFSINSSKNVKFVILNDDIQYTNFCDTNWNQISKQNGGTFRASKTTMDDVDVYRMFNKETDFVRTFSVDIESMTYVSRVSMGDKNLNRQLVFVGKIDSYFQRPTAKSDDIITS